LERVIDLRCEGKKRDMEMEGLADQLKEYYRIIHHQNHVINIKSMEYERKLDIQKREYLQKLALLTKSQSQGSSQPLQDDEAATAGGPDLVDAYERKVRSLKDELRKTREQAQLYKRFYRENKHRILGSADNNSDNRRRPQPTEEDHHRPRRKSSQQRRKSSGGDGSEGSQVSAIDAARVEKFQRHVQKMMQDQQQQQIGSPPAATGQLSGSVVPQDRVIRDRKKLIIMSSDKGEAAALAPELLNGSVMSKRQKQRNLQ